MTSSVTYNRRSFKINNRPLIILSGSVHYTRQHPSTWQKIFRTFHQTHLNTLETYIFWNAHDGTPEANFHGRNDLFGFITAAGEAGLHVILRIGPYICAESSYGGFPFRLRDITGIRFRTWNEQFMREVEAWVRLISRELHSRRLLASAGGPVILVQLENEYSMVSDAYGEDGGRYLQWCADLQKELDFGVPGIMCYGAAEGVVETINAFYAHEEIDKHRLRHADQPPVWTEAWTGWYDTWGGAHHIRTPEDLSYAVARFFASGGAGINYYMWAGGINYGREGMYLQVTCYDYDAPVDQFGRLTTKARHLGRLHGVLKDWFEGTFLESENDPLEEGVVVRWGDIRFICNDGDVDLEDVMLDCGRYDGVVKARSVHIVDGSGKCLYDSATIDPDDVITRGLRNVNATSTVWEYAAEGLPKLSGSLDKRIVHLTDVPKEQLSMTENKSDYAFYTTRIQGSGERTIVFEAADIAYVYLDGVLVGSTEMPPWEDRWSNKWNLYTTEKGTRHVIKVSIQGVHELCIMTASLGLVKGDWQLQHGVGMEQEAKGVLSDIDGVERTSKWYCVGGLVGETEELLYGDGGDEGSGWYRCTIRLEKTSESLVVDLVDVGKGLLWVNDILIGRFWDVVGKRGMNGFLDGSPIRQVDVGLPTQRFYHIPSWVLRERESEPFGLLLDMVLFVERGAPKAPLTVLESL